MRRIPLWLTIVPLVVAVGGYWTVWSGYRDTLRGDIARVVPGARISIGGFPYRMEAEVAAPAVTHGGAVTLSLRASRAIVNRTPWQRAITIVRSDAPRIVVSIPALNDVAARIDATSGVSSLHIAAEGRVERQSNVFTGVRAVLGFLPAPLTAATFEVHLRETPARSNEAWSATPPQQGEIGLVGTAVRFGRGGPLTMSGDVGVTSASRLSSYAAWVDGGTIEIRSLSLADASGEVARLTATLVPAAGGLRLTGTITTVCPATVAATLAGTPRPREKRTRVPIRLAVGGMIGAIEVIGEVPPPRAVRTQLPPCPALR